MAGSKWSRVGNMVERSGLAKPESQQGIGATRAAPHRISAPGKKAKVTLAEFTILQNPIDPGDNYFGYLMCKAGRSRLAVI